MPARIRLQRHGKKGRPLYHIVIADGRAPRDGKFIEKIGTYNPVTTPATIELDFDKALNWLQKGAQPSETAKSVLSFKGVLFKNHLLKGVAKGAFTAEQAEQKFEAWLSEKEQKLKGSVEAITKKKTDSEKERLAAESKVKEEREKALLAKKLVLEKKEEEAEVEVEAEAEAEAEVEATPEEINSEATTEEAPEVKAEAPAEVPVAGEEVKEESSTDTEEPKTE